MSKAPSRHYRLGGLLAAVSAGALAGVAALTPALAATGPSMTANHNAANIAVPGPGNSLRFCWANNGSATWHAETVAGPGSVR
ncbi:MAG: hypothetical protein ACRDRJ_08620 [Streptosporangiaceae bacterium]